MRHKHEAKWPEVLARFMAANGACRTQAMLAKRSGVPQSTIGRILRGESCPQAATMSRLAEGLGLQLKTLAAALEGGGDRSINVSLALSRAVDLRFRRRRTEKALEALRQEEVQTIETLESLRKEETAALDRLEGLVRGQQVEELVSASSVEVHDVGAPAPR